MIPRLWQATSLLSALSLFSSSVNAAITLNVDSADSLKEAAKAAAMGVIKNYEGNLPGRTPGRFLNEDYQWWMGGAAFNALIDYQFLTGDTQYNDITVQALTHQIGEEKDYMPRNQSASEGNDDQVFWAFAAMTAAEKKFPDPDPKLSPGWLELSQAVFNQQSRRWDNLTCGGGLRWQISQFNSGYDYKNSISNGGFFMLAARLYRYTGNDTYANWAETAYDWMLEAAFMSKDFHVFDGGYVPKDNSAGDCLSINHVEWTYNNAVMIGGAAYLLNGTSLYPNSTTASKASKWAAAVDGLLLSASTRFFQQDSKIMYEVACEMNKPPVKTCNYDQRSFKSYLARWLGMTAQLVPSTQPTIYNLLRTSAIGAAQSCNLASNGAADCGMQWFAGAFDGSTSLGTDLAALELFQSLLVKDHDGPYTATNGGDSKGNTGAGSGGDGAFDAAAYNRLHHLTTGDKAGAAILTIILIVGSVATAGWMMK